MSGDKKTVTVSILDKSYQVALPPGEHVALTTSARHLDQQMRDIRGQGKVVGLERIAVMAALNITNDMLKETAEHQARENQIQSISQRLEQKLNAALEKYSSR